VMNIHLPAILRFTRGTRFWPIPISINFYHGRENNNFGTHDFLWWFEVQ
jgi:hypothetical protein